MEFKLTIGATPELLAALSLLAGVKTLPNAGVSDAIAKTEKPKTKEKPLPATFTPLTTVPAEVATEKLEEALTMEKIRARVVPLTQAGKKEDIKKAVGFYGGQKLSDLKPENFEAFWLNLDQIQNDAPLIDPTI